MVNHLLICGVHEVHNNHIQEQHNKNCTGPQKIFNLLAYEKRTNGK